MSRHQFVVDWDGTVAEDSWPVMGEWMPGAVDALHSLLKLGDVMIDSCRVNPYEHGYDGIRLRPEEVTQYAIQEVRDKLDSAGLEEVKIHTTPGKPPGVEYIDNKGRRYGGRPGSWAALVQQMNLLYGRK